jgi:RimJ/RimL family protein N-acetyltransferase
MNAIPSLSTPRLSLGALNPKDIPQIVIYAGDKSIADTTLNIPHPYKEKDAQYWINSAQKGFEKGTQYTFCIRLKSTQEFIGSIGLIVNRNNNNASLGYWIAKPFWNSGFATEATRVILEFGFNTLKLHKIYATHLIENPASGKVMIKNGMIKEGELKDHYKKEGKYRSVIQYRLIKDEFVY